MRCKNLLPVLWVATVVSLGSERLENPECSGCVDEISRQPAQVIAATPALCESCITSHDDDQLLYSDPNGF